jgi:hypothetical protein
MLFPVVACCGLEFFRVSGRSIGGSRGAPAPLPPWTHGNASNFSIEIFEEKEEEEGGRKKKRKDSPLPVKIQIQMWEDEARDEVERCGFSEL